jgi:FkbM family methyltransferase
MSSQRPFKLLTQNVLRRIGLYERVKASILYDVYWKKHNQQIIADRSAEVEFYRQTLSGMKKGDLIFDIGANEGYKTDIFLRLGATVVAADPDETNIVRLKNRFIKYRLRPKPVRVVGKAVSDDIASKTMWVDAPGSAMNTLSPKWVDTLRQDEQRFGERLGFRSTRTVEATTIEELTVAHGVPFFIKIDVEGHEASVLRGMRRPVRYLSFEANLPEFTKDGLKCIERLATIAPAGQFNYATDLRAGLAMSCWVPADQFSSIFAQIEQSSVEVFWRNDQSAAAA